MRWVNLEPVTQSEVSQNGKNKYHILMHKRNAKRQNGCLTRPYKKLGKEKTQKAKVKRKDIPI